MSTQSNQTVTLAQVIAWVESKDNDSALRFEPSIWEKLSEGQTHSQRAILAAIAVIHKCSQSTAKMIYSTSWGRYQIMGFNLYGPEINLTKTVAEYSGNETEQNQCLQMFLDTIMLSSYTPPVLASQPVARRHFSLIWNGGVAYEEPLIEALRHLGFSITN